MVHAKRSSVPWVISPLDSAEDWLRLARKVEDALVGQINLFSDPDPEVEQIVRQVRNRRGSLLVPGTPSP